MIVDSEFPLPWEQWKEPIQPQAQMTIQRHGMESQTIQPSLSRTDGIYFGFLFGLLSLMLINRFHKPRLREAINKFLFFPNNHFLEQKKDNLHELWRMLIACFISMEGATMVYAYAKEYVILTHNYSSWLLLAIYFLIVLCFLIVRQQLYHFIHFIFFSPSQRQQWQAQYAFLMMLSTILLFPLITIYIYLLPDIEWLIYGLAILAVLVELLLFLKCFSTFFGKISRLLHLFAYLCALEIVPLFLLWTFLKHFTDSLTIL